LTSINVEFKKKTHGSLCAEKQRFNLSGKKRRRKAFLILEMLLNMAGMQRISLSEYYSLLGQLEMTITTEADGYPASTD